MDPVKESTPAAELVHTERVLRAGHRGLTLVSLSLCVMLAIAWLAWLRWASVPLWARARQASVEVARPDAGAHIIQSPFVGSVLRSTLELGRRVDAGELLVELDAMPLQWQAQGAQSRVDGHQRRQKDWQALIEAERSAARHAATAADAASIEARAQLEQAEAALHGAEAHVQRQRELHGNGMVSRQALDRAELALASGAAQRAAASAALQRTQSQRLAQASERQARIRQWQVESAADAAGEQTAQAEWHRLDSERERRLIRSPISGWIAELQPLRAGAVLLEGDRLATIVPDGPAAGEGPALVAQFDAAQALGRIRPGQAAVFRAAALPWTEHGGADAVVTHVARQARESQLRVELRITPATPEALRTRLVHGMQGQVDVLLERTSPWSLLTRAAEDALVRSAP